MKRRAIDIGGARPPRADRSEEFASFAARPVSTARMATAADLASQPDRTAVTLVKLENRVQQSIRDSARDEECTVRIVGACNSDPTTTVWSHAPFNDAGKGMGIKGLDLVGCYSCSSCHDVVDGRAPRPAGMSRSDVLLAWFYGMARSLMRLRQKGLV